MTRTVLDALPQYASPAEAASSYIELGWEPIVLRAREKKPQRSWKESRNYSDTEVRQLFGSTNNVGIALGKRSNGLIDIDFDWPEAALLGNALLSDLPSFGRSSSPNSHRLAKSEFSKRVVRFQLPAEAAALISVDRLMVLEIRGDGHMSMFPPSVHPSEELVCWHDDPAQIPSVESEELQRRCGLVAFLGVILRRYPTIGGDRDNICLALTGTLLRAGFGQSQTDQAVELVAQLAGDEEADKRGGKAAASSAKLDAGEQIWGLPELCERLGIAALEDVLRKWLGGPGRRSDVHDTRSIIHVRAGHIPEEVDHAERALIAADVGIYQRGQSLVRVVRLDSSIGEQGVNRAGGALVLKPVVVAWLLEKMALTARWVRTKGNDTVQIDPPYSHAATLLARLGDWRFPVLSGLVSSPTLRADGSILQLSGYDAASRLLFDPAGISFPSVVDAPTHAEAMMAIEQLAEPFREFAFATPADESVLLAAVLTALIRRSLPSSPLFAIDAPTASSGKSLLTETVGIITTGHKPTMMSQGKSPEEDEKRLSSVLMSGDSVLVIDNCDRQIEGDFLCTMLTQEFVVARVLGKSEVIRLPTNALVMATGNNLILAGDVTRRALICRLDTGEERPDLLQHGFDPREEALALRPALVVAGLTALRGYIAAGRPVALDKLGSFEKWNIVRETLVWLGRPDPADTRERIMAEDPRKGELIDLLRLWFDALGPDRITLAELAKKDEQMVGHLARELIGKTRHTSFNARSIGRYLSKQVDRVVAGLVLRADTDASGVKHYQVVSLADLGSGKGDGSFESAF